MAAGAIAALSMDINICSSISEARGQQEDLNIKLTPQLILSPDGQLFSLAALSAGAGAARAARGPAARAAKIRVTKRMLMDVMK